MFWDLRPGLRYKRSITSSGGHGTTKLGIVASLDKGEGRGESQGPSCHPRPALAAKTPSQASSVPGLPVRAEQHDRSSSDFNLSFHSRLAEAPHEAARSPAQLYEMPQRNAPLRASEVGPKPALGRALRSSLSSPDAGPAL